MSVSGFFFFSFPPPPFGPIIKESSLDPLGLFFLFCFFLLCGWSLFFPPSFAIEADE